MDIATKSKQERFNEKIKDDPRTGCWVWSSYIDPAGYGRFSLGGEACYAHRVSYEMKIGPIPNGLELDHLCRVRHCVNPAHLEPVIHQVNVSRGRAGWNSRAKVRCPKGHPYSGNNIYILQKKPRERLCKECKNRKDRERYQKNKTLKISNKQ